MHDNNAMVYNLLSRNLVILKYEEVLIEHFIHDIYVNAIPFHSNPVSWFSTHVFSGIIHSNKKYYPRICC